MSSDRPRVFLDINIGTEPAGRLTIELFVDKAPKTCENFRALCTASHPPLTYQSCRFHRIIDDFMIQGGDITQGDGTGGDSIYGGEFEDENLHWREVDSAGLVCMANRSKDTNSSQFFITLESAPHLNGKHTIFGQLVSGNETLQRMAKVHVDNNDVPLTEVMIAHCGVLGAQRRLTDQEQFVESAVADSSTDDTRSGRTKRGRRDEDSPSRSRSGTGRSTERHAHNRSSKLLSSAQPPTKSRRRRRSDQELDETRRGRGRRKLSNTPISEEHSMSEHEKKRHRAPSPSPDPRGNDVGGEEAAFRRRRSLPNHHKRYHGESGKYEDPRRYEMNRVYGRYDKRVGKDGRLDGADYDEDGKGGDGAGIKFKGRGSMKYQEPKRY